MAEHRSKRILILTEGQTESLFVRDILSPHFLLFNSYLFPRLATTNRKRNIRGGVVSYGKIKNDIMSLFKPDVAAVTTMIDFYALPNDFPGERSLAPGSCYQQVAYLEQEFGKDIADRKFIPYFSLHEFEALLFTDTEKISREFSGTNERELAEIRKQFKTPEEINDDPQTAPSKRLKKLFPKYRKKGNGLNIAKEIELAKMREACPHFDEWLKKLESL